MKKYICIMVMVLVITGLGLHGQSISVGSPAAGGKKIFVGQKITITWTKSGAMPDTVKIRLRRANSGESEPAVWAIANSTANTGSFGPVTIPASVPQGNYFIRVRTSDPDVIGDSTNFRIIDVPPVSQNNSGNPVQPQGLQPGTANVNNATLQMVDFETIDFEMLDVERETGSGVIFAKLRNNGGRAYNGPLTFLVLFGSDRLDPITVPVNLAAGATGRVNLMYYLSPLDLAMRGSVLVKVVADSATKIAEMNEQNNAASRTIAKTCPVYIKSFEIEVTPSRSTGPYPLPVKMTLRLDVIGQGELEIKVAGINNGISTRKYQFPASGNYVFDEAQPNVIAAWLVPHPQKPNCRFENAICPVVSAWVVGACADGGQIRSNEVSCRYEQ